MHRVDKANERDTLTAPGNCSPRIQQLFTVPSSAKQLGSVVGLHRDGLDQSGGFEQVLGVFLLLISQAVVVDLPSVLSVVTNHLVSQFLDAINASLILRVARYELLDYVGSVLTRVLVLVNPMEQPTSTPIYLVVVDCPNTSVISGGTRRRR